MVYPHRWPVLSLISVLATVSWHPVARGDTGPGPSLHLGSFNTSESSLSPGSFVGAGGYELDGLLHSDTLRQTETDQQGIADLLSEAAAYALTNYPLSSDQLSKTGRRSLIQVPIAFSPLVVAYKIPGIKDGELRLDSECLNGIYTCSIRYWNDARIVALNPSLAQRLPRTIILPQADIDDYSTTQLFKQYAWNSEPTASNKYCVTQSLRYDKSDTFINDLNTINNSIGYTAFASALSSLDAKRNVTNVFGMAAIKNLNGEFVAPRKGMDYPFRSGALPESVKSPDWTHVNVSASALSTGEPGAYPMGGLVYIITATNLGVLGTNVAIAMQQFLLSFLAEPFQGNLSMYGGVPLPQSQVMSEIKQIEALSTTPPLPLCCSPTDQWGNAASVIKSPAAIIGAVVGSIVVVAVLLGGIALCRVRYRRRMRVLQVIESIRAWRAELDREGLLVHHGDIQYECVPGSNSRHVVLGEGAYGKVYKGTWHGTAVAVKVLNNDSDSHRAAFVREAKMLKALRHPQVVSYLGCAISDRNEMMLVVEYMGGGDLGKALSRERGGPRQFAWEASGRHILLCVAWGLAYIHSKRIIIFDVKAANILLAEDYAAAKITDVGLAKFMAGSNTETLLRGTAVYMAPELFPSSEGSGDSISKVAVTQAVDIYSFGVLMWEVLTGERANNSSRSLRNVRVPEECPPSMYVLWKRCISRIPQQRPTADEIAQKIFVELKVKPIANN